ncbi:MAG: GNAT family N-acetyltransferase [Actinomycetota bacterium]|nr:GNAT family N-acetyltransferase [Actinomycetota bacterium]
MPEITFRRFVRADYPLLAGWRRDRAWLTWWGPARSVDELEDDYGACIDGTEPTLMSVAAIDGRDFALVETYRIADQADWNARVSVPGAVGIDYGIGRASDRGRGFGKSMLSALVGDAFDEYVDCDCIVAVPKTANVASCRALESVGFTLMRTEKIDGEYPGPGTSSIYKLDRLGWALTR